MDGNSITYEGISKFIIKDLTIYFEIAYQLHHLKLVFHKMNRGKLWKSSMNV